MRAPHVCSQRRSVDHDAVSKFGQPLATAGQIGELSCKVSVWRPHLLGTPRSSLQHSLCHQAEGDFSSPKTSSLRSSSFPEILDYLELSRLRLLREQLQRSPVSSGAGTALSSSFGCRSPSLTRVPPHGLEAREYHAELPGYQLRLVLMQEFGKCIL